MADDELANKLNRRNLINEGEEGAVLPSTIIFNPYTEFKEFSRKQIQDFQKTFNKWVTAQKTGLPLWWSLNYAYNLQSGKLSSPFLLLVLHFPPAFFLNNTSTTNATISLARPVFNMTSRCHFELEPSLGESCQLLALVVVLFSILYTFQSQHVIVFKLQNRLLPVLDSNANNLRQRGAGLFSLLHCFSSSDSWTVSLRKLICSEKHKIFKSGSLYRV